MLVQVGHRVEITDSIARPETGRESALLGYSDRRHFESHRQFRRHRCGIQRAHRPAKYVDSRLEFGGADIQPDASHLARRDIETVLDSDWVPNQASLVVDATGSPEGLLRAVSATRPRGTVVLKSTTATRTTVDLSKLVVDEIRVVGSRCGPFPPALRALETSSIDVRSLISLRAPLRDADEALRRAADPGQLKVLIETA